MGINTRSFLLGVAVLEGVLIFAVISYYVLRSTVLTSSGPTPSSETKLTNLATTKVTSTVIPAAEAGPGGQLLFIGNTGGVGVRLREACTDDARGVGGWPEGTAVTVVEGIEDCPGWWLVRRGEKETSWVRADYLASNSQLAAPAAPQVVTPQPALPTVTSVPAAVLQPPTSQPRQQPTVASPTPPPPLPLPTATLALVPELSKPPTATSLET